MGHSVGGGQPGDLPDNNKRALAPTVSAEAAAKRWETRNGAASQQPLVRMCTPEEIASVAIFLATPGAAFMTGTIVPVDGVRDVHHTNCASHNHFGGYLVNLFLLQPPNDGLLVAHE
jgi:hypothetical protein